MRDIFVTTIAITTTALTSETIHQCECKSDCCSIFRPISLALRECDPDDRVEKVYFYNFSARQRESPRTIHHLIKFH